MARRGAGLSLALAGLLLAAPLPAAAAHPGMVILGFDGLDPQLLEAGMARGELPNFSALRQRGSYSPLQSVTPPQSPVAWATAITGMDPGGTGIFDFIHRDPARMTPYLSTSRVEEPDPEKVIRLFGCILPLDEGRVELLRDGEAFWQILDRHGIAATVLKMPSNFPPVETNARTLSGMGTPDLQGTYGTFHFFTDDPALFGADVSGGGEVHRVTVKDGVVEAALPGPDNTMREGRPVATTPFTAYVDPEREVVRLDIAGTRHLLARGEWTPWVRVKFTLCPLVGTVHGTVRFYLAGAHPRLKLYASPVNLDPMDPALPISTPPEFAAEIAEGIGLFYTQGMPEDTKALSSGVFRDEDYLRQLGLVQEEEDRMMDWSLDTFQGGFLFVYFSAADLASHMLWRATDRQHPMWSPSLEAAHGDALASVYRRLDAALGRAMRRLGDDVTLLVVSDHGFAPFYREVNLNTWLKDQGYLTLTDDSLEARTSYFNHVDWGRTRAYALGFNSLYLNRRGRERWGIVDPGPETEELMAEIRSGLLAMTDPATGDPVVARLYAAREIYHGAHVDEAPDLLVGYTRGYRSSDASALGGLQRPVVHDRLDAWSGDHLMQTEAVPGVILSNRKLVDGERRLVDLAPTILAAFGLPRPPSMTGRSLLTP